MVKRSQAGEQLDAVFSALSDPTRRAIVVRLSQGEASVSELAEPFDVSLPAVTKHLQVLERAGLLRHERSGRNRIYHLEHKRLSLVTDWLSTFFRRP